MRSNFDYYRPLSADEAVQLKHELGKSAVFWAGGTDLMLKWKRELIHPEHCIDLTSIPNLDYVDIDDPDCVRIGSMATLAGLAKTCCEDPHLRTIARVAAIMDTVQTRTIATIGGNLCNASPAADLIPPLIAMAAVLQVRGPGGTRRLAVEDLMRGPGQTSLRKDELVEEIQIPRCPKRHASSYRRIDRTVVDIALVSAATAITLDDDDCIVDARISLGAVAPTVIRSPDAESRLKGTPLKELDGTLRQAVGEAASMDASPIDDVRASAEYRTAMVKVLVRRVLEDVVSDLEGERE